MFENEVLSRVHSRYLLPKYFYGSLRHNEVLFIEQFDQMAGASIFSKTLLWNTTSQIFIVKFLRRYI